MRIYKQPKTRSSSRLARASRLGKPRQQALDSLKFQYKVRMHLLTKSFLKSQVINKHRQGHSRMPQPLQQLLKQKLRTITDMIC